MRGLGAPGAEAMLKAGWAEIVTAFCRGKKRFHLGGAAIEAADVADEGARKDRRHIDALKLVVESTDGAMDAHEQWLRAGRRAGDGGFETHELLPERTAFCLLIFAARFCPHRRHSGLLVMH